MAEDWAKKKPPNPQRPRPCLFSVLVRCFSPEGSCGSRRDGGDAPAPSPAPICSPSPAARAPAALAPSLGGRFRPLQPLGNGLPGRPLHHHWCRPPALPGRPCRSGTLPRKCVYGQCFGKALISGFLYHRIDPTVDAPLRTPAHVWARLRMGLSPRFGRVPALPGCGVAGGRAPASGEP